MCESSQVSRICVHGGIRRKIWKLIETCMSHTCPRERGTHRSESVSIAASLTSIADRQLHGRQMTAKLTLCRISPLAFHVCEEHQRLDFRERVHCCGLLSANCADSSHGSHVLLKGKWSIRHHLEQRSRFPPSVLKTANIQRLRLPRRHSP